MCVYVILSVNIDFWTAMFVLFRVLYKDVNIYGIVMVCMYPDHSSERCLRALVVVWDIRILGPVNSLDRSG